LHKLISVYNKYDIQNTTQDMLTIYDIQQLVAATTACVEQYVWAGPVVSTLNWYHVNSWRF